MGLNPSKLSKQNRDEFEFNYKPSLKSGCLSKQNSIPTDIIHEIASFMTLKEITHSFSCLSKELRSQFFLEPTSPHWKIINLSDEIMFGDLEMMQLVRKGVLLHSEVIILRRTNITSHSLKLITKFIQKNLENELSLLDVRGCCKISRFSTKMLKRSKPSLQIKLDKNSDNFECSSSVINETTNIFLLSRYFNSITREPENNIIYYGCNIENCACDYCCATNVKMKSLMTQFGPFYLDVFVATFKYEFFESNTSVRPRIDCFFPIFGTSKSFRPTENSLPMILKKLWEYSQVKSSNLGLIYRKHISAQILFGEEEMSLMECFCDRYGPILVYSNDNIFVIATICRFGTIFTSFDRYTSLGNAIKASRFLSCHAHFDLVEIA